MTNLSKHGNVRFTTVPLQPYFDKNVEDVVVFLGSKMCIPAVEIRQSLLEKPQLKKIVFILDPTKLLRIPLLIGHCHLCTEGHMKLRLQSL